ncbi:MAG: putative XRE-type DNA-binding protein [Parvicellaceae bacterium]|jgi:predicted XRE-type DNA-binding protein
MIAIITGDIVNSQKIVSPHLYLNELTSALSKFGSSPMDWQIYRGDEFQLQLKHPEEAFKAAIYIKSCIKSLPNLDLRMAIGIGSNNYKTDQLIKANGEAFVYSGGLLDKLKKNKTRLAIKTNNDRFNHIVNLIFQLLSRETDNWSTNQANLVKKLIENENQSQDELAVIMGISQPAISKGLHRSAFHHIVSSDNLYRSELKLI